jgi:hypothetical protein
MMSMGHLTNLSKQTIDEAIGGDSFCFVDAFAGITPDGYITTMLAVIGLHPLSNIEIRVIDSAVWDKVNKEQGYTFDSMSAGTQSFSLPYLKAGSGIVPFVKERWYASDTYKKYSVITAAKNGTFYQLLRVSRSGDGVQTAILVSASYFDGRSGLVLEKVPDHFPMDLLKGDNEWNASSKAKHITVKSNALKQFFTLH